MDAKFGLVVIAVLQVVLNLAFIAWRVFQSRSLAQPATSKDWVRFEMALAAIGCCLPVLIAFVGIALARAAPLPQPLPPPPLKSLLPINGSTVAPVEKGNSIK